MLTGGVMVIRIDRIDHRFFNFGQKRIGGDMIEINGIHGHHLYCAPL